MRDKLLSLYKSRLSDFTQIKDKFPEGELNGPFLMSPNDLYRQQRNRLLIVGQETYGWSKNMDINKQMEAYENFNVGTDYHPSPFWNVVRKIEQAINSKPYSCAWTNISKYDLRGGRVYGKYVEDVSNIDNLLANEIDIIQPTICLFFTGPTFDIRLSGIFENIEFKKIDDWGIRQLVQLKSPCLPIFSFRTYHPNYLRRSGLEGNFINFITKAIT